MKLNQSILYISYGTWASITKFSKYDEIDIVKRSFERFSERLSQDMTWQEAWEIYISSKEWRVCKDRII